MKKVFLAVVLLLALAMQARAAYVDFWGAWSSTQQVGNVLYQKVDAAGTISNLSWDGSKWTDANQVWMTKDGGTTGRLYPGSTGAGGGADYPHPLLTWIVNQSGYYSMNGSQQGCTSIGVAFRQNGTRTAAFPVQGLGSPYNYTFPYAYAGDKLSIEITSDGDSFGDANCVDWRSLVLSNEWVFLKAANEKSPNQFYGFNVSISNSTNTTVFTRQLVLKKLLSELPTQNVTFVPSNHTCQTGNVIQRSFYGVNATGTNISIGYGGTFYLLCDDSSPVLAAFAVQTTNGQRVQNAFVTALKSINGVMTPVTNGVTDASGVTGLYLDLNTVYQITASASGYNTFSNYIQPTVGSYTITLSSTNDTVGFQTIFDGMFYSILPDPAVLSGNFSNLSFYMNDSLSQMNYWGWNITYQGLELYLGNWTTNSSGGFDYVTVNMTEGNKTGNMTVYYWFSRSNFSTWTLTKTFLLNPSNFSNSSLVENLASPKANGASNLFLTLMVCIIAAFITAPFSRMTNQGSGVIALLILAIATFMNFLGVGIFSLTAITYACYLALVRVY